jgi:hypothetical protein
MLQILLKSDDKKISIDDQLTKFIQTCIANNIKATKST